MADKIEAKDNMDDIYYVEFEQGYRYVTEKGDWIILSKHTNDEPGARFMHLTLLDKDTYHKAKRFSEEQQSLEDLMDQAARKEASQTLNKNDWESE